MSLLVTRNFKIVNLKKILLTALGKELITVDITNIEL